MTHKKITVKETIVGISIQELRSLLDELLRSKKWFTSIIITPEYLEYTYYDDKSSIKNLGLKSIINPSKRIQP